MCKQYHLIKKVFCLKGDFNVKIIIKIIKEENSV